MSDLNTTTNSNGSRYTNALSILHDGRHSARGSRHQHDFTPLINGAGPSAPAQPAITLVSANGNIIQPRDMSRRIVNSEHCCHHAHDGCNNRHDDGSDSGEYVHHHCAATTCPQHPQVIIERAHDNQSDALGLQAKSLTATTITDSVSLALESLRKLSIKYGITKNSHARSSAPSLAVDGRARSSSTSSTCTGMTITSPSSWWQTSSPDTSGGNINGLLNTTLLASTLTYSQPASANDSQSSLVSFPSPEYFEGTS